MLWFEGRGPQGGLGLMMQVPRRLPVLAVAIVGGRDLLAGPRGQVRQASEAGWRSLLFLFWKRGGIPKLERLWDVRVAIYCESTSS